MSDRARSIVFDVNFLNYLQMNFRNEKYTTINFKEYL